MSVETVEAGMDLREFILDHQRILLMKRKLGNVWLLEQEVL